MNLYGEYGNINILKSRIEEQGIKVNIIEKSLDDEIKFNDIDFVYCGSGTEKNKVIALEHLKKYENSCKEFIENGGLGLFTGNSLELLGKHIKISDKALDAIGVFNFDIVELSERVTADVILKSNKFDREVIGFINKQSRIENNDDALFKIVYESGLTESNNKEGFMQNNLLTTYLIGPLLVKNPEILKFYVDKIITKKFKDFKIKEIGHKNEEEGYNLTLSELTKRKLNT
jgi:CobQ-like glutamine amidotransferase family enzyme